MKKQRGLILGLLAAVVVILACLKSTSLKRKAQSVNCGNQMIAIGYAARSWADDHDGHLPPDLSSMSNEIIALRILICPGDASRRPAESWSSLTSSNASYQVVSASAISEPNALFLRCPIHGFVLRADGAVFDCDRQLKKGIW